ncbi:MAG: T9SS type A sorting domain-containing protein, partial [Bacteroidales bacterium]|nr:T9SS type A sorting domain-containing protein [Bacteroidales bacterium]
QATNTLFRNNRRSAEFLTYDNHTSGNVVSDNTSHFTRCTFTINDDNLFAENNVHFGAHVTMYRVRGVKINGCAFRNEVTATTNSARGNAISTIEAGFKAKRVCPVVSPFNPCSCIPSGSDTVTRCSFSGFHSAISAANSEGNYDITIDNCDFAQNTYGVDMAVCNDVQVSSCDFNLDGNKTIYGVTLTNCTGYTIEDNSFYKAVYSSPVACGTNIINSGIEDNVIRLNRFSNIKFGCGATDTNALTGMDVQGLHYECNSFDGCMNGIYVFSGASVRTVQGSNSAGADNGFGYPAGSGKSITIPASHDTVTYYYSKWGNYIPYGNTRIKLRAAYANNCLSSLCGSSLPPIELLSQYEETAEEMLALYDTVGNRTLDPQDAETAELQIRLADLSSAMGDLSRNGIRAILSDTTLDMGLLKEWYGTIVETRDIAARHRQLESGIPVAAYHLAEVYNTEGDYAAADALLQSLPQRFNPDEAARHEYENYMNLQRLRESVAGNWYRQTDTEIAELQQVVESDSPVREITVYSLTGQVMMTIENCPSPTAINVVSLPRGIYLLHAVTDNGVKTARFVKN